MIILKILGIVAGTILGVGIIAFIGFFILAVWVVFSGEEHTKPQICPECGKKARYYSGKVEEAGGQLSFTDAIHARYRCPKGHIFTKTWTVRNPLG